MKSMCLLPILRIAKKCSPLLVFAFLITQGTAENFRVRKLIPIALAEISESITVTSGINDALWVTLPEDMTYVSGLELKIKVPEDIITWRDSVAYMLYENISPTPAESQQNYRGERTHIGTIPGNFSLTLYIPLSLDFAIKSSPYSVMLPALNSPIQSAGAGIFLRFMMVMKGVPESLENAVLEISAKPVLKKQGALSLLVLPEPSQERSYSVFIDDAPVQDYMHTILPVGEHHLSVVSDSYRNELRTFRIEQAKTTALSVTLRGIEPLLKLLCPKDTQVFLDGSAVTVSPEPIPVSQGEHTVKFILGDYEVVKTVSAQNGKTYSVSLTVDASITEE